MWINGWLPGQILHAWWDSQGLLLYEWTFELPPVLPFPFPLPGRVPSRLPANFPNPKPVPAHTGFGPGKPNTLQRRVLASAAEAPLAATTVTIWVAMQPRVAGATDELLQIVDTVHHPSNPTVVGRCGRMSLGHTLQSRPAGARSRLRSRPLAYSR